MGKWRPYCWLPRVIINQASRLTSLWLWKPTFLSKRDYKMKPLFFSVEWCLSIRSCRNVRLDHLMFSINALSVFFLISSLIWPFLFCWRQWWILHFSSHKDFLHVNSGYPLFSHVQTHNFYYGEKIMCGARHTFAAGVQNDERNRKHGVGCISIYLYANYQSSQKCIFHLHWGLEDIYVLYATSS